MQNNNTPSKAIPNNTAAKVSVLRSSGVQLDEQLGGSGREYNRENVQYCPFITAYRHN